MAAAAVQVRPAFWILLLLALLACAAMKLLVHYAKQDANPDFQIAVYRYPADAMPDCAQLLGRTVMPLDAEESGTMWVRLQLPPVTEIATGACRVSAPVAM